MGKLQDSAAIEPLLPLLSDGEIRATCVESLLKLGFDRSRLIGHFRAWIETPEQWYALDRSDIVAWLVKLADVEDIKWLSGMLTHISIGVRKTAITTIASLALHHPEAVDLALRTLDHNDRHVQLAMVEELITFEWVPSEPVHRAAYAVKLIQQIQYYDAVRLKKGPYVVGGGNTADAAIARVLSAASRDRGDLIGRCFEDAMNLLIGRYDSSRYYAPVNSALQAITQIVAIAPYRLSTPQLNYLWSLETRTFREFDHDSDSYYFATVDPSRARKFAVMELHIRHQP